MNEFNNIKSKIFHCVIFIDIPHLLRIPIDPQLNTLIIEQFNQYIVQEENNNDFDKIQTMIDMITQLLNDLKNSKDIFLQQSSKSFVETCLHCTIESSILQWIPSEIRCENYVPLNIHLVRLRSTLQEQKVNLKEKTIILWQEYTNLQEETHSLPYSHLHDRLYNVEIDDTSDQSVPSSPPIINQFDFFRIHVRSLFKLQIKQIPSSSLTFFQELNQYQMEERTEILLPTKAYKFTINYPDGGTGFLTKVEKVKERLRKIFDDHRYNREQYVLIDKNEISVDSDSTQITCLDYRIVERKDLITIQFQFRQSTKEYFTISTNRIATIIKHFININQPIDMTVDTYLYFYDDYGVSIEDVTVDDLYGNKEKPIVIIVKEKTSFDDMECEINLRNDKNFQQTIFFDSTTTWQQIELRLKRSSVDDYAFLLQKQNIILDKSKSINSVVDSTQSDTIIDVINQQLIISVVLSYEDKNQNLQSFQIYENYHIVGK
ncbi:hypothetical protein I4U23_011730 [Adineta vaga]|nr:hypothetical protein I4U23_011730 [Adineta vaga]